MTITFHPEVIQGSEEWAAMRCGIITASEMKLIITPTLKIASNDKERTHLYELLAQRITRHVEPQYVSDDMLRGREDEVEARELYSQHYAQVSEFGFVVNDDVGGCTVGYSPDGFVGDDGGIECKSRRQKYQVETLASGEMPAEYQLQVQTGLMVTGRKWCDFVSFSAGLPMFVKRIEPDPVIQEAIRSAVRVFEMKISTAHEAYRETLRRERFVPTERRIEIEMFS